MRFLADQNVFASTSRLLQGLGHDVVRVADLGLARATDESLLEVAIRDNRILITRDRDFGNLVFVKGLTSGVLFLRIEPSTVEATHKELERVLKTYTEADLSVSFVVVEPGRHRLRRLIP
jgi:predicted nuclease of predicted toxin-antitoxin system